MNVFQLPPNKLNKAYTLRRTGVPPDHTVHDLISGGLPRWYLLHVPRSLDPRSPAPVILAFHGWSGSPRSFVRRTRLSARAGAAGFIVAYPAASTLADWNLNPPDRQAEGVNDIAFVEDVLEDLQAHLPASIRRVYVTGNSSGALFIYHLACHLPERIGGVAAAGGTMPVRDLKTIPARPVPILHFHGTRDPISPYYGQPALFLPPLAETIEFWKRRNGCAEQSKIEVRHGAASCASYPGANGAGVTLWTVERMGHQWPGGKPMPVSQFGPYNADISATDLALAFFLSNWEQDRKVG